MTKQEYQQIPTFMRKESNDYWELGEQDQDFDEKENTPREDLDQERLCQEAQDEAIADVSYIDKALEEGKKEGRSITF